jgi:two-component system OmpR family sensor kinase
LLIWLILGQFVAVLAAGVVTFLQVDREVNELVDDQLRLVAVGLENATSFRESHSTASVSTQEYLLVQVWEKDRLLFDSQPELFLPRHPVSGFSTYHWRDQDWRSFQMEDGLRTIQVTQPLEERLEMGLEVAFASLGPVLGLIPVLALLIWFGVGYGVRPLSRIVAALERRRPDSLQPLPVASQPREVQPLVAALNDLFGRLELAMEGQRKFVADAAHELRTPLAAVQLQAQLLQRGGSDEERRLALQGIRSGTTRAAHLVQQLLALARLAPEGWHLPQVPVDLSALASAVVVDYAPMAQHAGLDLGMVRCEPSTVMGDMESFRVLLGNLIDNAIRYTPDGGRIDVDVYTEGNTVRCEVQDTGPGIPVDDRERVFDRFYRRLGNTVEGSGLGLSIVREVAHRYGGEVRLTDAEGGSGLKVTVAFPRT